MSINRGLLISGTLLFISFAVMVFWDPFNKNISPFLICFAISFIIYLITLFINKNKSKSPTLTIIIILSFAALFRLALLNSTPSLSDDIYRYVWDGRVQLADINPYAYPPGADELSHLRNSESEFINHPNIRTIYPLLTQWIFRLGAWIHPSIYTQRILFSLFDYLTIIAVLFLLIELKRPIWNLVIYAWNPLVIVEFSSSGHNDSLMIFCLVVAILLLVKNKNNGGALMVGCSIISKWVSAILIPWIVVNRSRRFLIPIVVLSLGAIFYLKSGTSGIEAVARDWEFNAGLYQLLYFIVPSKLVLKALLATLILAFSFLWAKKTSHHGSQYMLGVLGLILLFSPVVHPWYVTWIVPFLCVVPVLSGIMWTGLVALTYVVLIQYGQNQVWNLPGWVVVTEYGLVLSLLSWEIWTWIKKRKLLFLS